MSDRYRVISDHPETISTGASFAPGEEAVGLDPKDPHDKALLEDGKFVVISEGPNPVDLPDEELAKWAADQKVDEVIEAAGVNPKLAERLLQVDDRPTVKKGIKALEPKEES